MITSDVSCDGGELRPSAVPTLHARYLTCMVPYMPSDVVMQRHLMRQDCSLFSLFFHPRRILLSILVQGFCAVGRIADSGELHMSASLPLVYKILH